MIWLAAAALAEEPTWPELEAAIAATNATVQRGPSVWTLMVSGRPMVVPAPRTAVDAAAIAVLVRSLGSGFDLVPDAPFPDLPPLPAPPGPAPQPVEPASPLDAQVAAAPPAGPPTVEPAIAPAPIVAAPPPRGLAWGGVEMLARARMAPTAGIAFGAGTAGPIGIGVRLAVRLPRTVTAGGTTRLLEALADAELFGPLGGHASWSVGAGVAGRVFYLGETLASGHALPRAAATLWVPVSSGPLTVTFGLGAELDLAPTTMEPVFGVAQPLPPVGLRIETRVSRRHEPPPRSNTVGE